MTPPVRGHQRTKVILVLVGTAASSGALAGFVLGVVAMVLRVPAPTARLVGGVLIVAIALDLLARRWRRCRPLAVHTQVPREWGRIFRPETAAGLYGLRLGVGPLTILTTWLWWAAVLTAAALGPWVSITAGVVFGAGRVVVSHAALVATVRRGEPAARIAAVRAAERTVTAAVTTATAAAAVIAVVLG